MPRSLALHTASMSAVSCNYVVCLTPSRAVGFRAKLCVIPTVNSSSATQIYVLYRSFYVSLPAGFEPLLLPALATPRTSKCPRKGDALPPPLRPAEPAQCLPPLSMRIGRTYSKCLREMLTFISLREMLTFISLRSIKLATHQIPPRKKNPAPGTWPLVRFHPGKAWAQTQIPPRENSGPVPWAAFHPGGNSGPGIRAQVPPGRKLGPRCSRPNSLGTDLPCPRQSSCPCAPISPSLCHLWGHHVTAWPPLGAAIGSVSPR